MQPLPAAYIDRLINERGWSQKAIERLELRLQTWRWDKYAGEGGGQPAAGVENLRNVIRADKKARKWGEVIARALAKAIIVTGVSGLLAGMGWGLKIMFHHFRGEP